MYPIGSLELKFNINLRSFFSQLSITTQLIPLLPHFFKYSARLMEQNRATVCCQHVYSDTTLLRSYDVNLIHLTGDIEIVLIHFFVVFAII